MLIKRFVGGSSRGEVIKGGVHMGDTGSRVEFLGSKTCMVEW